MLETLTIQNLALVDHLEIEFGPGFNVVSGETGAGKSLILGALKILLGDRTSRSVIRRGADRCEISAQLRTSQWRAELRESVRLILDAAGIPQGEDDALLLRRVVTQSGSRVYANSTPCTVSVLAQIGERIVDIHGPDNTRCLLRPGYQLELLDNYARTGELLEQCRGIFEEMRQCQRELEQAQATWLSEGERELVEFQLRELEEAELRVGEESELNQQYDRLANAQSLMETASECCQALDTGERSVTEQLADVLRRMADLEDKDPEQATPFRERLEATAAQVQDVAGDLAAYAESLELDDEKLNQTQERLDLLHRLARKYGGSIESAIGHAKELRRQLDDLNGKEARIRGLVDTQEALAAQHAEVCKQLSKARGFAAESLAEAIAERLHKLGFAQSEFEVRLEAGKPGPDGADHAEFCFAPNPGEAPMPLRQIASSGEIARTMLAVKTVLSAADSVPILVFDEVDANIGGRVANEVARELAALGDEHQTLCISHLPQIAAAGQRHFRVVKQTHGERTRVHMERLDDAGRETELTRMLGGQDDSTTVRHHARELLESAAEEPQPA